MRWTQCPIRRAAQAPIRPFCHGLPLKSTCLAALERVRKTRLPIRVTKFGEPVAEVVPPAPKAKKKHWLGSPAGTIRIEGDIVAPASDEKDWEILNS